ncbi:polygalacturonase QRT2-like [Gastrolobium bilobum]|uniref:polygalacturonase QRT2-like n=1 Tax=Gastrolobium bilobum TaxID=150636 RepID=UPI002AAFBA65|nr:polygalacturonase QRT2-like [Gastrolobium bilobum]
MSPQSVVLPFLFFFFSFGGFSFGSLLDYTRFQIGYPRYSWPGRLEKSKYERFGFTTWADRFTPSSLSQSQFTPSSLSQRMANVNDFGAKPNDDGDDTQALEKAWNAACSTGNVLLVPENSFYYLKSITFLGPCKLNIAFTIRGTIIAWPDMSAYENTGKSGLKYWIMFDGITNLRVDGGGLIYGNGKKWWMNSCKINKNLSCKDAPTAVTFVECNSLRVANLKSKNAQQMHFRIQRCKNVRVRDMVITAPEDSPNTDGIHVTETQDIIISDCNIMTGDDCISIVSGSQQVRAINITCGPGHGISIGSLGADNSEAEVFDVLVNSSTLIGTDNGVRIKTWQGGSGFARNIRFMNIEMQNVYNPIFIDQKYCDQSTPCPEQGSAVELSDVRYQNIKGTSASEVAIKLHCSKSVPCKGLYMQDVVLTPVDGGDIEASCANVVLGLLFY